MNPYFLIILIIYSAIWWLAVYLISRNPRSQLAWVTGLFLASVIIYGLSEQISIRLSDINNYLLLWGTTKWSFIIPIPLIFSFAALSSGEKTKSTTYLSYLFYSATLVIVFLLYYTDLIILNSKSLPHNPHVGFENETGTYYLSVGVLIATVGLASMRSYLIAIKKAPKAQKTKHQLAACSILLYLLVAPYIVFLYNQSEFYLANRLASTLLLVAFLPVLIAILFYRLISDVDYIFNWKEFVYLSLTILLINFISGSLFIYFIAPKIGELSYVLGSFFMLITITTHGFYDWLTTFTRDLFYNAGKGFSLITDTDVADFIRFFHDSEKLEPNTLLKFKVVKTHAKDNKLMDASRELVRDAIAYFKQPNFPRRTKQNLKYQILKMTTFDEAEEGQILWELGFEGYPMKIMNGENRTREPLFKIEAMSDYTATSRNAFIALKKEAIHDLTSRLSYLERTIK